MHIIMVGWDVHMAKSEWENSNDFKDCAEICFKTFGDRVKKWLTINEPLRIAKFGHAMGIAPPGRCSDRKKMPIRKLINWTFHCVPQPSTCSRNSCSPLQTEVPTRARGTNRTKPCGTILWALFKFTSWYSSSQKSNGFWIGMVSIFLFIFLINRDQSI